MHNTHDIGAAGESNGDFRDPVQEHGQRWRAQHIHQPQLNQLGYGIPQEFPADQRGQDHPPIFTTRGRRVVGIVFVVGVAVLAEDTGYRKGRDGYKCGRVGCGDGAAPAGQQGRGLR